MTSSENLYLIILSTPPTTEYGGTSFLTMLPAAITAPSPILTPSKIIQFAPIHTSLPIYIFLDSVGQ